jgi:hypothetical protein
MRCKSKMAGVLSLAAVMALAGCVELKQAGRTIGHTSRDVAREVGHGTRDAAKAVGHGTRRVAKEITADEPDAD